MFAEHWPAWIGESQRSKLAWRVEHDDWTFLNVNRTLHLGQCTRLWSLRAFCWCLGSRYEFTTVSLESPLLLSCTGWHGAYLMTSDMSGNAMQWNLKSLHLTSENITPHWIVYKCKIIVKYIHLDSLGSFATPTLGWIRGLVALAVRHTPKKHGLQNERAHQPILHASRTALLPACTQLATQPDVFWAFTFWNTIYIILYIIYIIYIYIYHIYI
jgi:hypothetical protein